MKTHKHLAREITYHVLCYFIYHLGSHFYSFYTHDEKRAKIDKFENTVNATMFAKATCQ